nr:heat-inducible transcriptional repressor HrcA [Tepidiphilus baoligensis]
MMLDPRSRILLKTLIERYIAEGQPIGSRTLSRASGLDLSPATVRNVMSDLDELRLVYSPHASAGRVPTAKGYRFFIDALLTVAPLEEETRAEIEANLQPDQPQKLLRKASELLSELTHFAGVVIVPPRDQERVRQIEFVPLSGNRVLLIVVTQSGDVQNRLLHTPRPFSAGELEQASNFLSSRFAGHTLDEIRTHLRDELAKLQDHVSELMRLALSPTTLTDEDEDCLVAGETNLLEVDDFTTNMQHLRELFRLFEERTGLLQLLELAQRARGVQIFIGAESGLEELEGCSVITANYTFDGRMLGSIGVIGPNRMAYDRVIPIVELTAQRLSQALAATAEER